MDDTIPGNILGSEFQQDIMEVDHLDFWENFAMKHNIDIDQLMREVNVSSVQDCKTLYQNETKIMSDLHPEGFCDSFYDSVLCWPPTRPNQTAVLTCFEELDGVMYDSTNNATKDCMLNGTWDLSNYAACKELIQEIGSDEIIASSTIYCVGYSISLVTLLVAITVFLYYKDLKCLRNRIHTNLMCAYVGMYSTWLLTLLLGVVLNNALDVFLTVILYYFHLATFFWMFVEGLYLYILVVQTLRRENFKLRYYVCIGWGGPLVLIVAWTVIKGMLIGSSESRKPSEHITWMTPHPIDWIHKGPTAGVLVLNLIFLGAIMYVLITKLRSANNAETQQYRKAAKALVVLMPLLGGTYLVTIFVPNTTLYFIRAVLLSTQGFTVALLYCFFNAEVRNTVKHHISTWKTNRSLGQRRLRSGSRSKDWSPRSRTESIRLYSQPLYKRESCTSDVTTTTVVTVNGGRSSNGGGGCAHPHVRSPFLQPPRTSYTGNV